MGRGAEMGKRDVDEIADDAVLVSRGARGDEGAVGRFGVTVAQGFGEHGEWLLDVHCALDCLGGGPAGRRPGGGDVGDALACGLPALRRDHGEQLGSCHEFQRGVQRERVRCLGDLINRAVPSIARYEAGVVRGAIGTERHRAAVDNGLRHLLIAKESASAEAP